jgi:hypothetical protein
MRHPFFSQLAYGKAANIFSLYLAKCNAVNLLWHQSLAVFDTNHHIFV